MALDDFAKAIREEDDAAGARLQKEAEGEIQRLRGWGESKSRADETRLQDAWNEALRKCPRLFLSSFLHLDPDEAVKKVSRDAKDPASFLRDNVENIIRTYHAIARAVAYHLGLAKWPPGQRPDAAPHVTYEDAGAVTVATSGIRDIFIASRERHLSGLLPSFLELLDRLFGQVVDPQTRRGFSECLEIDSSVLEALRGKPGSKPDLWRRRCVELRNDAVHRANPPTPQEALAWCCLLTLPWRFAEWLRRPCADNHEHFRVYADGKSQPIRPGSALDALGWTGFVLWLPSDEGSEHPESLAPRELFRLCPLFPTHLPADLFQTIEKSGRSTSADDAQAHRVDSMDTKELQFHGEKGGLSRTLLNPTAADTARARSLLWMGLTCDQKDRAGFSGALTETEGGRSEIQVGFVSSDGSFPTSVEAIHLSPGPFWHRPPGFRSGLGTTRYGQASAWMRIVKAEREPQVRAAGRTSGREAVSWLLPRSSVSIALDADLLRLLEQLPPEKEDQSESDPEVEVPRTPGLGDCSSFVLSHQVDSASEDRFHQTVAKLLDQKVVESPWLPDLYGKGSICVSTGKTFPVVTEVTRDLTALVTRLDGIRAEVREAEQEGRTSPWSRPETLLPYALWVLLSASRGLEALGAGAVDGQPADPEHIGVASSNAMSRDWYRLCDFEDVLVGEGTRTKREVPVRWRLHDKQPIPASVALARLAWDLIDFVAGIVSGRKADREETWMELGKRPWCAPGSAARPARLIADAFRGRAELMAPPGTPRRRLIDEALGRQPGDNSLTTSLELVLKCAVPPQKGALNAALGTSALADCFQKGLAVVDLFYAAALDRLALAVEGQLPDAYEAAHGYLEELRASAPCWTRSSTPGEAPGGPEGREKSPRASWAAVKATKIRAALQSLSMPSRAEGLRLLSRLYEGEEWRELGKVYGEAGQQRPQCRQFGGGAAEMPCHCSFAVGCPCTEPITTLLDTELEGAKPAHRGSGGADSEAKIFDTLTQLMVISRVAGRAHCQPSGSARTSVEDRGDERNNS